MKATLLISNLLSRTITLNSYAANSNLIIIDNPNDFSLADEINSKIISQNINSILIQSGVSSIPLSSSFAPFTNVKTIFLTSNSLTGIPESTFASCGLLEECILSTTITTVGGNAFAFCHNLKSINLKSVQNIGIKAFFECHSLKTIELNVVINLNNYCFKNCYSLSNVTGLTGHRSTLGYKVFHNCWNLSTLRIHNQLALANENYQPFIYSGLKEITIDSGVNFLFTGCKYLQKVTFSDSCPLTQLKSHIFEDCSQLSVVTLCASITSLESYVFVNTNITSLNLFNVISMKPYSSYNTGIKEITINKNINPSFKNYVDPTTSDLDSLDPKFFDDKNIDDYSSNKFGCICNEKNLKKVILGSDVTEFTMSLFINVSISQFQLMSTNNFVIENQMLYNSDKTSLISKFNDTKTENYEIPNSIPSVKPFSFISCTNIKTITIPDTLTNQDYLCAGMINLQTAKFTSSQISKIPNGFFYLCHKLSSIVIPESSSISEIGDLSFAYCFSLVNLMKNDLTKLGKGSFVCCVKLSQISSEKITEIPDFCFMGITDTTKFNLPKSQSIGYCSFYKSDLTKFDCPEQLLIIKDLAFMNSMKLETINFNSKLTSLGSQSFDSCSLKEVLIVESIKWISNTCFENNPDISFKFDENSIFGADNKCFYYKNNGYLLFTYGDQTGKFEISDNVKYLDNNGLRFKTMQSSSDEGGFLINAGVTTLVVHHNVVSFNTDLTNFPYITALCFDSFAMSDTKSNSLSTLNFYNPSLDYYELAFPTSPTAATVIYSDCVDNVDKTIDPNRYIKSDGKYDEECIHHIQMHTSKQKEN